ncbi:MAG: Glu-tRNA(Gln) amidotransferase subunit GatE, partial [Methanobacteriota archaeon]
PAVLRALDTEGVPADEAIRRHAASGVSEDEVRARARAIVETNRELVEKRGTAAQGPLMGDLMKEFRGKVDGKVLARVLGEEIGRVLKK